MASKPYVRSGDPAPSYTAGNIYRPGNQGHHKVTDPSRKPETRHLMTGGHQISPPQSDVEKDLIEKDNRFNAAFADSRNGSDNTRRSPGLTKHLYPTTKQPVRNGDNAKLTAFGQTDSKLPPKNWEKRVRPPPRGAYNVVCAQDDIVSPAGKSETPKVKINSRSDNDTESNNPVKESDIPNSNIAVAFMVALCFNLPLGIVAIFCSISATKAFRDGNRKKGFSRARTSIFISLFAIVTTVLVVMVVVLYITMKKQEAVRRISPSSRDFSF